MFKNTLLIAATLLLNSIGACTGINASSASVQTDNSCTTSRQASIGRHSLYRCIATSTPAKSAPLVAAKAKPESDCLRSTRTRVGRHSVARCIAPSRSNAPLVATGRNGNQAAREETRCEHSRVARVGRHPIRRCAAGGGKDRDTSVAQRTTAMPDA